ncbi:MAG: HAD family hydrolase [Clostridia bacterium]|nr:HAD family hydrolase [Clostridia bacterium]
MKYSVLLCDGDDTLLDFQAAERAAFAATVEKCGLCYSEDLLERYSRINISHWKRLERGETTQERLRVERFADFLAQIGCTETDATAMCLCFMDELGKQGVLLPGALDFCRRVRVRMPIVLVTNGIAQVQHQRFARCGLAPYIQSVVISEEIGSQKPEPEMVYEALRRVGSIDPRRAVLMGDSVTADIAAARNAGVDSILFTRGTEPAQGHGATYVAQSFAQAEQILLGEA